MCRGHDRPELPLILESYLAISSSTRSGVFFTPARKIYSRLPYARVILVPVHGVTRLSLIENRIATGIINEDTRDENSFGKKEREKERENQDTGRRN